MSLCHFQYTSPVSPVCRRCKQDIWHWSQIKLGSVIAEYITVVLPQSCEWSVTCAHTACVHKASFLLTSHGSTQTKASKPICGHLAKPWMVEAGWLTKLFRCGCWVMGGASEAQSQFLVLLLIRGYLERSCLPDVRLRVLLAVDCLKVF